MLSPMDVLQESRQRVGDSIEIHVDSGIRRGSDILKALALALALALDADACSIGTAYLYGLVAAGSPGVGRIIDIFADELRRTMTLVGVSSISELKARGGEILRDIRHSGEILETNSVRRHALTSSERGGTRCPPPADLRDLEYL
jgi:L-lactate dehydrogenase (cytochrome)